MVEMLFSGGALRMKAYNKLKVFLGNPGKFCLIVLGDRGTGKHFAIEKAFAEMSKDTSDGLCLKDLKFYTPAQIPVRAEDIDKLCMNHEYQTVVIEDVERLTDEQQDLLFTTLSTIDGKFGVAKKYNLRFVFTSSKEIEELREDEKLIQGYFWDRISQLVVELPSYKTESENAIKDFQSTWKKMKFHKTEGFEHFASPPKNATMEKFLEDYAEKFDGGFRDLDKLACMYFNYRILHYRNSKRISEDTEKEIVNDIKEDFLSKSQLHSSSGNDLSMFQIRSGFSMDELNAQFRIQVRKWALLEYKTLSKAADKLKLGPGTLKNYVAGKATKMQRDNAKK